MKFDTKLAIGVVVATVLMTYFVSDAKFYGRNAPCNKFNNEKLSDVPAHCYTYFTNLRQPQ